MKKVQFLFLFSVLYLSAVTQQKSILYKYDFTCLFSSDYRHYIKKSHEASTNTAASKAAIAAIIYGENFSVLKHDPLPNNHYYFIHDYGHRKNFAFKLLQSEAIGTIIQSVIQDHQVRQILRR